MKLLVRPLVDDLRVLDELTSPGPSRASRLLGPAKAQLADGYREYVRVGGDVQQIAPLPLAADQSAELKRLYSRPIACLSHVQEMRDDAIHDICAMCGAHHVSSLDHIFPKHAYPEYAVFSANLVPACQCNARRGTTSHGNNPGERVLHPYFDVVLERRLIAAHFDDIGEVPRVAVRCLLPNTHPMFAAVQFHIEHVVRANRVHSYLVKTWDQLFRRPSSVVRELRRPPASLPDLRGLLREERERLDVRYETKNGWEAMFISGLLERPTLQWLYTQLARPGRDPDGPLLGAAAS
jgi:hypothetical protein